MSGPVLIPSQLRRFLLFFLLGLVLWMAFTGDPSEGWLLGLPATVAFAYLLSRPGSLGVYRLHPLALFRFFLYFGWQSVRGGLQVALMAVASKERIQPHFFVFTTRLPPGTARVVFANAISLMPGTLTWMLEEELVHIHVLNDDEDVEADLRRLEMKIASIFGLTLERDA